MQILLILFTFLDYAKRKITKVNVEDYMERKADRHAANHNQPLVELSTFLFLYEYNHNETHNRSIQICKKSSSISLTKYFVTRRK